CARGIANLHRPVLISERGKEAKKAGMTSTSERHQHYQTAASATSSVLSIIGAFYIIGRYWYARRLKAKSLSVYAASAHHLDVTKELIHIIAYLVSAALGLRDPARIR
ncbi:hypothetical protein BBJ28_00020124, partial [Nothophytophthora sp. Chile5]